MTASIRKSPRLASKPRRNSVFMKKLKQASQFSMTDVIACVYAPLRLFTKQSCNEVCKNAKLPYLVRSPLITLRCYEEEMDACLSAGNPDAHFVEGVKQYFALNQTAKGLKHLKISSNNHHRLGTYLYAILLMITGKHEEGMEYMDLMNWKTDMLAVDRCWERLKRSLRDVPIVKRESYGTDMILIMPPRSCMLRGIEDRCTDCYYYKQMQMFLKLIT